MKAEGTPCFEGNALYENAQKCYVDAADQIRKDLGRFLMASF